MGLLRCHRRRVWAKERADSVYGAVGLIDIDSGPESGLRICPVRCGPCQSSPSVQLEILATPFV